MKDHIGVTNTLETLKPNLEKASKILLCPFGSDVELVDREDSIQTIMKVFEKQAYYYDQYSSLDKLYVYQSFMAAAPGVGKSKLLKEVGLRLFNEHFRKDTLCFPLFVSFGNGVPFDPDMKPEESLFKRICTSFICSYVDEIGIKIFEKIKNVPFNPYLSITHVLLVGTKRLSFTLR